MLAAPPEAASRSALRCRSIEPADLASLAALLARGFPARDVVVWRASLARLCAWVEEQRLPGLGYVLADGDRLVGCLLTIYASEAARCNLSSWYADDAYRRYASLLVNAAMRDRAITYLNVSSMRHTRPIIEAQGFRRYNGGVMLAAPLLSPGWFGRVRLCWKRPGAEIALDPGEAALMEHHAAFGCIVFWCVTGGRAYPFVFVRRRVMGRLPFAQLVYCADGTDWRRLAPVVGYALARHGLFLTLIDTSEPVPGLLGRFLSGRMLKYARGPAMPRCGDLAYTEIALIGA